MNKLSSDITEFMPTIALKLKEKAPMRLKDFLKITDPKALAKFLTDNASVIEGISSPEALQGVINGIVNLASRPKIIEKVKNGNSLAKYIIDYVSSMSVKNARVTNEKNKNDSADIHVMIGDKDIGLSVKDDAINGKGHSLRDVSLLKQISDNPEYDVLFNCISYDKFVKALASSDPKLATSSKCVNTKQYFEWIGKQKTAEMEKAINANKTVYSQLLTYTFNLDNPDTLILSQSGVYTNDGKDETHASYTLILCKNLLEQNSKKITVKISASSAT